MRPSRTVRRRGSALWAMLAVGALALAGVVALPAAAAATPGTFSGSCQVSGPITPSPPITVVPKSGSQFSYAGQGTCTGTLDGMAVTATPNTLSFTDASTLFDTCEFGPDVDLSGELVIGRGANQATFAVTIDLARLALAGPFAVTTPGGGQGAGTATFTPPSTAGAVQDCAAGGIGTATLAASFRTTAPLVGAVDPTGTATVAATATTGTTPPASGSRGGTRRCTAVHRLVVRLHPSRGQRVVSAVIYLDGHRREAVRGHRLISFSLGRVSRGAHTVRLVTRTSRGRVQRILRRYDICG